MACIAGQRKATASLKHATGTADLPHGLAYLQVSLELGHVRLSAYEHLLASHTLLHLAFLCEGFTVLLGMLACPLVGCIP